MGSGLVLLTPAHNEGAHLGDTIESILAQAERPDRWIIVNDASSDDTGTIAEQYAADHAFIEVIHTSRSGGRGLKSKASAVAAAFEVAKASPSPFQFVASMDADVVLPPPALSQILDEMRANPQLGISGGRYFHPSAGAMRVGKVSATHVPGPLQVFRSEVFEAVGGYRPMRDGGLDVVSTAHARMLGWETRITEGVTFTHKRQMGTGGGTSPLRAAYNLGVRDHTLGSSMMFIVLRSLARAKDPPYVLVGGAQLLGFVVARLSRRPSDVPDEVAAFIRQGQIDRVMGKVPLWRR